MSGHQPHLSVVGASHHTTPIELRERLALTPQKRAALGERLRRIGVDEYCLLGTCNRVEVYTVGARPDLGDEVAAAFCELQGIATTAFREIALRHCDADAVNHLFAVATGLDSQMVGEAEILGQVKGAYAAAQEAGEVGPVLNRVFQKTFQSAKLVRSETSIGEGQVSVATVGVALAEKIFGRLRSSRVLVLGAGDIAEKTAKALRSRDAGSIAFANRTATRAAELAEEFGGTALSFESLAGALARFDIVVASTASPDAVITVPMVYAAMQARASRPLFLIDLALPRDIDPGAAELPNVFLYNLDDLARLAEANIAHRRAELEHARGILRQRADSVWAKLSSGTAPAAGDAEPATGEPSPTSRSAT